MPHQCRLLVHAPTSSTISSSVDEDPLLALSFFSRILFCRSILSCCPPSLFFAPSFDRARFRPHVYTCLGCEIGIAFVLSPSPRSQSVQHCTSRRGLLTGVYMCTAADEACTDAKSGEGDSAEREKRWLVLRKGNTVKCFSLCPTPVLGYRVISRLLK